LASEESALRRTHSRQVAGGLAVGLLLACVYGAGAGAQTSGSGQRQIQVPDLPTSIPQIRFNAGQSVVPYYEGWIKNPDGSFGIVFGYFNRNWQQELVIPAGPDNKVEPGGPDAGQPTYFLPRRQRWIYRLRVPEDFGKKEATWTITANGHTEKVVASLIPAEEINERVVMSNGNFDTGVNDPNKPPTLTVPTSLTSTVAKPLTLTANVADDGLPKPRPVPASRSTNVTGGQANFGAQVNSSGGNRLRGLRLTWLEYRGPAKVTFDPAGPLPVTSGQAVSTTAHFAAPGAYVLRATANDGALSTTREVTINVSGASSTGSK
jgi:hypothetical protein